MSGENDAANDFAQAIAELVAKMPIERAAQAYDFVRFLQTLPTHTSLVEDDNDWLNDSEEQMRAEDALWDGVYARHSAKFNTLAEAARAEITAGVTKPMFSDRGEINM